MTRCASDCAACDYCGLPAGPVDAENAGPVYCCYGCRFAAAVAQEKGEVGRLRWSLTRLGLAIFFSMNVMVFTLVLWSLDVFPDAPSQAAEPARLLWDIFRYLCLLFSAPVLLLLGGPLLENAVDQLRRRRIGVDLLLLAGVAAAYGYSASSVVAGRGHVYFETGCMILVAVTLGRWLEATGKWKATDALKSLSKLLPAEVAVVVDGVTQQRPLEEVAVGDCVQVTAGQRIPVDGVIVRGRAALDEQIATGESRPVEKSVGDSVLGGTVNLDGLLLIEAVAPADGSALQRLIDAVVAAASVQDRWRRLADRI
ncbi:MAG: cation-translocating P-type ATPase, partial [Planctomycetales bacterium]|nr:cation-translocating P-type ATPase [Planctomycetales bacterium]